jgi:hypothetical protein
MKPMRQSPQFSGASASSSPPSVNGEQVEELRRRQDDGEGLHADLQRTQDSVSLQVYSTRYAESKLHIYLAIDLNSYAPAWHSCRAAQSP